MKWVVIDRSIDTSQTSEGNSPGKWVWHTLGVKIEAVNLSGNLEHELETREGEQYNLDFYSQEENDTKS